jgi:three-Cys-motif partner protein
MKRAAAANALTQGDDGLPVFGDVGPWVRDDKHRVLGEYLKLHAHPRAGFDHRTYVELFCGPGRARVRGTGEFIDGSPVVAWKASQVKAPFTAMYIADSNSEARDACAKRLRKLGAPVIEVEGDALTAAAAIVPQLDPYGFHFAFVDPYNLGELRLELLSTLATLKRMDQMVHLSAMDLFRNLDHNLAGDRQEFDDFAPGWQERVKPSLPRDEQRRAIVEHWKAHLDALGLYAHSEMKQVRNSVNRDLYWLLVLSRHPLAGKFWEIVLDSGPQPRLL